MSNQIIKNEESLKIDDTNPSYLHTSLINTRTCAVHLDEDS